MVEHKDDFKAAVSATPASQVQIADLGKQYNVPEPRLEYTPLGDMWINALTAEQQAENDRITDKRLFMMRRLQKQNNKAKAKLNEAANRRSGNNRRQRDNENSR